MKRNIVLVLSIIALVMVAGCATLGEKYTFGSPSKEQWIEFGVKQVSRGIGYFVGTQNDPDLEALISVNYNLLVKGELSPEDMTEALSNLDSMHPLLASSCIDLLDLVGAGVIGGTVVDLSGINPALFPLAENAYNQGLLLGKAEL